MSDGVLCPQCRVYAADHDDRMWERCFATFAATEVQRERESWEQFTDVAVDEVNALRARLAAAEGERDEAREDAELLRAEMGYHEAKDVIEQLAAWRKQLQAELAEARAQFAAAQGALTRYGKHTTLCSVAGGYDYACTCGLADALAAPAPAPGRLHGETP